MGSKGGATTTSSSAPPQMVQDMYKYIMDAGKSLQQKPYESYSGELVPQMNAIQQAGIDQSQKYSQAAQPYLQQAGQMTQQAAAGYNPQNYAQGVAGYMSPYMQQAMGATAAQMNNINQQQQQTLRGSAISQGAFGGDRANIGLSNLMNQQDLAMGQTLGQMANQGYQSAAQNYITGLQNQGALGAQYGNIGNLAQTAGMTGGQQLATAGAIPYSVQQAMDAAKYQQFAQGQAYPWQTLGSLANMASGLGAGQGGMSSTTSPGPNSMNAILGLGTSLLTMSDERSKDNMEPIGKTFDGQNIYKFNYKGDPKTNIGLMAQEVEKHNPSAVHKTEGGLRMVDYDAATEKAADRGHFAMGGSSMGGLVSEGMERQPFAKGGYGLVPYADDPLLAFMEEKSSIPLISYIPNIDIKGSKLDVKEAPAYEDKPYDTSGIAGFGKALYGKYGPSYVPDASKADMLSAYQDVASKYSNYVPDQGTFAASGGYAEGGLVARSHHAGGDTPPKENEVPSDWLGGLGSSISKGLASLPSTKDQPGLIGNLFNKGEPLSDDARQAIMAAGFGIMASPSPFLAQAIGQGGLTGMNTYAKQKQLNYETQKTLAEQALKGREVSVQEAGIPIEKQKIGFGLLQKFLEQYEPGFSTETDTLGNPLPVMRSRYGGPTLTLEQFNSALTKMTENSGLTPEQISGFLGRVPARQGQAIGGQTLLPENGGIEPIFGQKPKREDDQIIDSAINNVINNTIKPKIAPSLGLPELTGSVAEEQKPIQLAQAAPATKTDVAVDSQYPDIDPKATPTYYFDLAAKNLAVIQAYQKKGMTIPKDVQDAYEKNMSIGQGIAKGELPTRLIGGETGFPKSILDTMRQKNAEDKIREEQALFSSSKTKEAATYLESIPAIDQILNDFINVYSKVNMNRAAPFQADLIGLIKSSPTFDDGLKTVGLDVDDQGFQSLADVGQKNAIAQAFQKLGEQASAKAPGTELTALLKGVADPDRAPGAKYQIVAKSVAQKNLLTDRYNDWIDTGGTGDYAKFVSKWMKDPQHDEKKYLQEAVNTIPYFAGMTEADVKNLPVQRTDKMPAPTGKQTLTPAANEGTTRKSWMKPGHSYSYDKDNQRYYDKNDGLYFKINGEGIE